MTEKRGAGPLLWCGFGAMCLGMFMAILDIQVVVTSLPTIQAELGVDKDLISWVQTAYLIAEVIAIPLTGYLTRAFTMRGLFVLALSVFTAASAACAASTGFGALVGARIVQGFAGGMLIPLVFSAVFLLFPVRQQALATTIGGVLAVLAPTVGPVIGGWITETYSWPWLFLVNVLPGIASVAIAAVLLPKTSGDLRLLRRMDWLGLAALALGLALLEISLKEAPERGWTSLLILCLLATVVVSLAGFVVRSLRLDLPIADLGLFRDRNFSIACALSFIFGMGLFGSVYLMPVFLGLVRGHGPLDIGLVMLVTGVAQLLAAPVAVQLEQRIDARILTAGGFLCFAAGLGWSFFQTAATDFDGMFWPQVLRGCAIMFCLLPPTRIALGLLAETKVPDGSAIFNLMRNLGGAIGVALIDTVIWQRVEMHSKDIGTKLVDLDPDAAAFADISIDEIPSVAFVPPESIVEMIRPQVEKAGLTLAINDAWAMVAVLTAVGVLLIPFVRRTDPSS